MLAGVYAADSVDIWPDSVTYAEAPLDGVRGHRQVTDAYLVALAASVDDARLATLDEGLVDVHPDIATLLPG